MKIGIDISQVVYTGTGVSAYMHNLVKALIKYYPDHDYLLFGSSFGRRQQLHRHAKLLSKSDQVSRRLLPFPPSLLDVFWNRFRFVPIDFFTGRVDVFHTSDWIEPPSLSPKVTTIHDLLVYKYPKYLPKKIVRTQKRKLESVKVESRMVIADSKATKSDIIKYLKIDQAKIRVVYLGIGNEFKLQEDFRIHSIKRKYQIPGAYILSVGTREPRKNLRRVVKAFEKLNQPELFLVIVGNVGWSEEIKPGAQVKLLQDIPIKDLVTLYSGAKAFVYPSLYEGFGLPVLEAMACGVPVITSDKGSLAEISGPATLANPNSISSIAEAIKEVSNYTANKRKKIITAGIKHAKNFSWQKTARETIEVYKSVL